MTAPLALLLLAGSAQISSSGPLSPGAFEATLGIGPIAESLRTPAPSAPSRTAASTRFKRDPALLRQKEAQIVAAMRRQSPQAAAEVEQLFARDLIGLAEPELRRMGLDHQDMADMTAVYWVSAWEASNGIVGRKTDAAIVKGARDQLARAITANPALARMSDREKQDIADTMLLQTMLIEARMDSAAKAGPAMQQRMSDAIHAEANQILKTDLRKVALTAAGFAPSGKASAPPGAATALPPAGAAAPAAHPENWSQVEGVYFRSFTGFGIGGMVTVDYEPLVLFRDGSYYELEGEAIEDMDLAASRRMKPAKWGRWARTPAGFTFIDPKGKASQAKLQGGNFFKAFPAEAGGNRLAAKYSRVSGGGNSALGGELTIAAQNDLTFAADGRYMRASSGGAIGSGSMTGVATSAYSRKPASGVGSYRIRGNTITLTEPNGQTRRQFFAFGSKKTPPQPATDMIFVGDRVFVVMDD